MGYRTPGDFSTPGTPFGSLSRTISAENLSSSSGQGGRDTTCEPSPSNVQQANGNISPAALQYGLQNIRVSGSGLAHSLLIAEDHNVPARPGLQVTYNRCLDVDLELRHGSFPCQRLV